jgi:hypothetical protein
MPDQVILDTGEVGLARMLALEFLHVVLAEAAQSGVVRFAHHFRRKLLWSPQSA